MKYNYRDKSLTLLEGKPSLIGFHKAILIERRGKPFIYCIGGYSEKDSYRITEKYHVQKDRWKKMQALTCEYGDLLVNMSLFYFQEEDVLYCFGGQVLDTSLDSKPRDCNYNEFSIQRLKLRK